MKEPPEPRFLLASHLGKLARWLRFLGYDAAIYPDTGVKRLATIASREKRIFLTRSGKKIFSGRPIRCRQIHSENLHEQLRELSDLIRYSPEQLLTRCAGCNRPLADMPPDGVKPLVPQYIFHSVQQFRYCRHCGRVFWEGTHTQRIRSLLEGILKPGQ